MLRKRGVCVMTNNLQHLRWIRSWSQEMLAIKSGVSRSLISKLENREITNPSIDTAYKLSKALNVDIWDIFKP